MSVRFIADQPWADIELQRCLRRQTPKRVAIAYVGTHAQELLQLAKGDRIVVDASKESLRGGRTDPAMLREWVDLGVEVRTLDELHAKVVILGRRAPGALIVGSANASRSSTALLEAVALIRDSDAYRQASEQFDLWWELAQPVDLAWAKEQYRPPKGGGRRALVPTSDDRVWIVRTDDDDRPLSPAAQKRQVSLESETASKYDIWPLILSGQEADAIARGDCVIAVQPSGEGGGGTKAWVPALVRDISRKGVGKEDVGHLVALAEAPGVTWAQLREVLDAAGLDTDSDPLAVDRRSVRKAVLALWGL